MKRARTARQDLVTLALLPRAAREPIAEGAVVLPGAALEVAGTVLAAIEQVVAQAPWRHMMTPGGARMSVAMTNCGTVGWVSDRRGYRYASHDPDSGRAWPPLPQSIHALATAAATAAGFPDFEPDACLVNRYLPGTRLSLHQDRNERDLSAPVVSVSLGLPALFLFGGLRRTDPAHRIALLHGDVVVWGGKQRLAFHGVAPLAEGEHPLTGHCRINLTLRRAL
ncbi:MAG TPA: DNA oxidative demethylase AlkB [Steroidobacteraceae bacterium]|jgi:alkylated DNA repair protein (DNA oxidative demethylase)